jgi:ligand-binding sensor domain-containing protein
MKTTSFKNSFLLLLILQILACTGQKEKDTKQNNSLPEQQEQTQPLIFQKNAVVTTFPQIHTNLNGMVREFVRKIYQDTNGNYWFATNGEGIIRYDGNKLEKMKIPLSKSKLRVMTIEEDQQGNIWFGTANGLLKYDGKVFTLFSKNEGLPGEDFEIWSLAIDKNGLIWVGTVEGLSSFDGKKFTPFPLPKSSVENPKPIYANNRVSSILEDHEGNLWISKDGHGIFKYSNGSFTQFTTKNGLIDNNSSAALLDQKGNIWISSYFGGASLYNGSSFTHFTKNGQIQGNETGSFLEDKKGNIWFSVENVGVYKYSGDEFTLYTSEDGLTSNLVLSIFEDQKGQLWFTTWQGICIFNGEKFVNANTIETWMN